MTSVTQLPAELPGAAGLPPVRRPGIAKALDHLTGSTSLRAERDARIFKSQLMEALRDPVVLKTLSEAALSAEHEEGHKSDALDFDGTPILNRDEENANGAQIEPAAAASPEAGGTPIAPLDAPRWPPTRTTVSSIVHWRKFQSNKTIDTINAQGVEEMIDSHYTMTAWLMSPTHAEQADTPGNTLRTFQHSLLGMLAVTTQCLIVKALVADLIDTERWGNAADDLLGSVKGLDTGSSIIGRELPYCRSDSDWNNFIASALLTSSTPAGTMCWPKDYCATLDGDPKQMDLSLIDEANARFGYINNCWSGAENGKAMTMMEIITDFVLTLFLGFEIYSEQQELFLQALIFHAVPRAKDGVTLSGGLSDFHGKVSRLMYCFRLWSYTLFIGFRIYLIGIISLASAVLIVSDASVTQAVLNGIALLFIVEFDNKMWAVGSWGKHSRAHSDGGEYRSSYKAKLLGSWNIRPVLRAQEKATARYATVAMVITFALELHARHVGLLFNLSTDEYDSTRSAFAATTVVDIWENGVGFVTLYIIVALALLCGANLSLHVRTRLKPGEKSQKTTVSAVTSVIVIALVMIATLIATVATEVLLLWIVKRGEPFVKAESTVIGRSDDGELQLQWTSTIVDIDNWNSGGSLFWYSLAHFCLSIGLVLFGESVADGTNLANKKRRQLFYIVVSLVILACMMYQFVGEVIPIM